MRKYTWQQHVIAFLAAVGIWAVVICAMLAVKAYAGEAYMYTTQDGVVSFTDDPDMVPPMYQAAAQKVELAPLADYPKLTVSAPIRFNSGRLDRLRQLNANALTRAMALKAVRGKESLAMPITATQEMHWVEGHLGYSGARYVAVDVLRDARGRTIATSPADIGLGPAALVVGMPR